MKTLLYSPIVLSIIVIVFSGTLINTPLQSVSITLNLILLAFLFCLLVKTVMGILFKNVKIKFSFPYLMLLGLMPILAAITANINFGQNLGSGLNAGYQFYNYLIIFYFYYYFKYSRNPINTLSNIVITLGWILLLFYYFLKVTMPDLTFEVPSYDGTTTYTYSIYLLNSYIIPWTGLIYLAMYKETSKLKHLLFFLLFISYQLATMHARTFTIALLCMLFVFFARELTGKMRLGFMAMIVVVATALFFLALNVPAVGEFFETKSELFADAVDAATGAEGEDASANARVSEVSIAQKYLQKNNYIFGVGNLKASTADKYLKEYFYASDIGLIGVVFTYGLLGLLIISYQLKFFFSKFSSNKLKFNPFLIGTAYYLLLQYINSIANGQFVFRIGCAFMLLSIIYYGSERLVIIRYTAPEKVAMD